MKKEKSSLTIITLNYIIALIPLILYGIYKNGLMLYLKEYINIVDLIKVIILPFSAYLMGILVALLFKTINKEKISIIKDSFLPLYGVIISCIINPGINIFIFLIILFMGLCLIKLLAKIKIVAVQPVALIKVLLVMILSILGNNTYHNLYESNTSQALTVGDYIFGRGIGGLFSTNIFLIVSALIFLSFTKLYKKEIPIYMLTAYSIMTIIITLLMKDMTNILFNITNSTVFFGAVFIAPDMITSPYTKKGRIVYGILLGLLCSVSILFKSIDIVFISIFLGSLSIKFIDKIFALK